MIEIRRSGENRLGEGGASLQRARNHRLVIAREEGGGLLVGFYGAGREMGFEKTPGLGACADRLPQGGGADRSQGLRRRQGGPKFRRPCDDGAPGTLKDDKSRQMVICGEARQIGEADRTQPGAARFED